MTQIHVQSRHKKAKVCCRSSEFPMWKEGRCLTVNVAVPLAIAYFQRGGSTKGSDIKNMVRHARDTFSMVSFSKQGSYGNGVPLGFGRSAAEVSSALLRRKKCENMWPLGKEYQETSGVSLPKLNFEPRSDIVSISCGPRRKRNQAAPSPESFWTGFARVCCCCCWCAGFCARC